MKMKPILVIPAKPRGLLIYDADREIDVAHPLWNEIMLYGDALEEVHCIILVKNLPKNGTRVVKLAPTVFAYYIPGNHLWWHFDEIVDMIRYHMVWKREFRPHFVLNFSTHNGAWIGKVLAQRYRRAFYVSTSGTFLEMPILSIAFLREFLLVRAAHGVFVPGERIADTLVARAGVRSDKVSVVRPAVDSSFLGHAVEPMNFGKLYPEQKFFVLTQGSLGHKRDLLTVIKAFMEILVKYPRAALIILTPSPHVRAMKRIVSLWHTVSIHVHPIADDIASFYAGAQLYLSASDSDEATVPIIRALGLHVPVVTMQSGIAKELFQETPYARYMATTPEAFTTAAISLVEHQSERDAYRLNSIVLLKSLSLQNLQGHVAAILAVITKVA